MTKSVTVAFFEGTWNGFGKNGQKKMSKMAKTVPDSQRFSPLTLTFLLFITLIFLTPNRQLIFSFAEIKLKISVRDCGGWSHDRRKLKGKKLKGILTVSKNPAFSYTNFAVQF